MRSISLLRHQHHTKQCYGLNSDRLSRRDRLYCKLTQTHFSELTSENYPALSYTDLNDNKHNNKPQYSQDQALKRFANSQLVVVFVEFLTMMATLITFFFRWAFNFTRSNIKTGNFCLQLWDSVPHKPIRLYRPTTNVNFLKFPSCFVVVSTSLLALFNYWYFKYRVSYRFLASEVQSSGWSWSLVFGLALFGLLLLLCRHSPTRAVRKRSATGFHFRLNIVQQTEHETM